MTAIMIIWTRKVTMIKQMNERFESHIDEFDKGLDKENNEEEKIERE